jgi:hypothetical protein
VIMNGPLVLPHKHDFKVWKRGFPLKLCKCGFVTGIKPKIGQNTIDVGAAGAGDIIRWSGTQVALAAGDIGMSASSAEDANGRMDGVIMGDVRRISSRRWEPWTGVSRLILIQQNANRTTWSLDGIASAPTTNGTATVVDVSTGEGQFIFYTSAAAIDSDAGIIAPTFDQTRLIYRPIIDVAIRSSPAPITVARRWVGVFSGNPMASATPALHYMAFRQDTTVDGTTIKAVCDNGSGTPTVVDTTVTLSTTTSYRLRIVVDQGGAAVRFYINGILRATITTTLPTSTQDLGYVVQSRTLEAVAKGVRVGRVCIQQKAGAANT